MKCRIKLVNELDFFTAVKDISGALSLIFSKNDPNKGSYTNRGWLKAITRTIGEVANVQQAQYSGVADRTPPFELIVDMTKTLCACKF